MSFYDCQKILSDSFVWYLNSKIFLPTIIVLGILIFVFGFKHAKKSKYLIISDINVYSVKIKLNLKNIDVAYMIYIQLRTRKIGIGFEENDVIIEVYNSWYATYKAIRDSLLSIRPTPKNADLIDLGIKILNQGMRPHLTKWQAKFRKWYDQELCKEDSKNLSPQEIQRKYPEYPALVADLRASQTEILGFIGSLEKIFKE